MKTVLGRSFISSANTPTITLLVFGLVIFAWGYATYPSVPGASSVNPEGWWGWADQGEYIEASHNFISGKITWEAQKYPPLYPFLGSIFLPLTDMHSYLPISIILLSVYLWMFMRVFSPVIGAWRAFLSAAVGLLSIEILFIQWVVPWTSSLAAALQMLVLFLFARYLAVRQTDAWTLTQHILNGCLCGAAAGLLAATRPVDLVAFSPVLIVYACMVLADQTVSWPDRIKVVTVGIVSTLIPVVSYLGFNLWLFGSPFDGYFAAIEGSGGAAPQDLLDRTLSHLVDAQAFYAEGSEDWKSRIPWVLFFLCFVPFSLLSKNTIIRVCAALIVFHLILVYSFSDAVPTGQFRYYNIHYFKWMYPVLPVFLIYGLTHLTQSIRARVSFVGGLGLVIVCVSLQPTYKVYAASVVDVAAPEPDGRTEMTIRFDSAVKIDFIDVTLPTVQIGQYNNFQQFLSINGGYELKPITDFRLTPRPGGIRIVLTDPTTVETAKVSVSGFGEVAVNSLLALGGSVDWRLGKPFGGKPDIPAWPPAEIKLNGIHNAAPEDESNAYLTDGWFGVKHWGR